MLTLAMILTMSMTVRWDGSEKVSGMMIQEPQSLNLSGEWEGTLWDAESKVKGNWTVKLHDRWLVIERGIDTHRLLWQMTDEGKGKARIELSTTVYVGIYRHERNRVIIALQESKRDRPNSFRLGSEKNLLILRRAKSGSLRFLGIAPGTPE
jgi:hypothetical protein